MVAASPYTILLVEDEPDMAFLVESNFVQQGYAVTVAADAEQARAAIDSGTPDLLLLDVNLPDGSGFDLLRGLRIVGRDRATRSAVGCFALSMGANGGLLVAVVSLLELPRAQGGLGWGAQRAGGALFFFGLFALCFQLCCFRRVSRALANKAHSLSAISCSKWRSSSWPSRVTRKCPKCCAARRARIRPGMRTRFASSGSS